jgi:uncharacterized protein
MTNFIPVFPLGIVVFPGEQLNLHIFEPRYKQLINECFETGKPFGIPAIIENQPVELGTLVTVEAIVTRYNDGRMDIITRGETVFRVLELIKEIPDKLYGGAIVTYPENQLGPSPAFMKKVLEHIRELLRILNVSKDFKKPDEELTSYDVAHHAGLSTEDEYELLGLMNELQRLEYLKRSLVAALKVIDQTDKLREKVKLNGHFKDLKGLDLQGL